MGEVAGAIADAARDAGLEKADAAGSTTEAAEMLAEIATPGDLVLIKGSRAARIELVLENFAKRQATEGVTS